MDVAYIEISGKAGRWYFFHSLEKKNKIQDLRGHLEDSIKTSEVGVAQPKLHDFFTESFFGSQAPVICPEIFIS
jgi:hypothetical protein